MWDALRDLVPFAKFIKRGKHPRESVTFSKVAKLLKWLKPGTLLKVTVLHLWNFHVF